MFDFIVNLSAGKGKSKRAFDAVCALFAERGVAYVVHETRYAGHASEIATEVSARAGEKDLVVFGGDGTFNEVLNGIVSFEGLRIGLIPCGTGNDFARAAGLSTDPKKAALDILEGVAAPIDFIDAGVKRALNCAGAGMDVDVLVRYSTMKAFHGKLKYYASLIDTLIHLKFHRVRLCLNGETREEEVFMIAATNGTSIGGGMPLSPHSEVADEKLNLVLIHALPKRKIPLALIGFLRGKHIDKPYTEEHLCTEVAIEVLDDGKTEVDGEVFENRTLSCKIISGKLNLYRRNITTGQ